MAKSNKELNDTQKKAIEAKKANIAKQVAKKQARIKRKRKDAKIKKAYLKRVQDKIVNEVAE